LQARGENLFLVGWKWAHRVEEGRADEEAFSCPCSAKPRPSIDRARRLVGAHLNVVLDLLAVRVVHHRPVMSVGIGRDPDPQPLDRPGSGFSRRLSASSRPTGTTTGSAMQRSPADPKAAPARSFTTWSRSASGMTMPWFLAPPERLHALSVRGAARVDCTARCRRPDEADRVDSSMVEDRVDHLLVAVHHVEDAVGSPASFISSASRTGTLGRAPTASG
jgi:hypothetical protein